MKTRTRGSIAADVRRDHAGRMLGMTHKEKEETVGGPAHWPEWRLRAFGGSAVGHGRRRGGLEAWSATRVGKRWRKQGGGCCPRPPSAAYGAIMRRSAHAATAQFALHVGRRLARREERVEPGHQRGIWAARFKGPRVG